MTDTPTSDDTARVQQAAEALWQHALDRQPYFKLRQGLPVQTLPLGTLAEAEEDAGFAAAMLRDLDHVDSGSLDHDDALTLQYLRFYLRDQADADDMWWTAFSVTPYSTHMLGLYPSLLFAPFEFASAADVERYLSLIGDLAGVVRTARAKTVEQAARGWGLPGEALPGIAATWRGHRSAYVAALRVVEERTTQLTDAARNRLCDGIFDIVGDDLLPAMDELIAYIEGAARDTAVDFVGLGRYPGGDEAYAQLVRHHASFDISAEQVHAEGLAQVASLTERMQAIRDAEHFAADEAAYAERLRADARFYAGAPSDVEATYRRHVARIEPLLLSAFAMLPEAPYDVQRLDPALEGGMTFGYYEPPTVANAVGRYRYNGSALDTRSQLGAAAIIYHELVPGHHFHLARQSENTALPMLRREVSALTITAFTEGWAEYAADVAGELGCYDDPWDAYGHLVHQRFLAQRLVIDTGMNALGWTLHEGRDYMSRTTMEGETQVATETLRYATDIPGQALGYRLGFARFHQLRERTRHELGERFDLREFHEQILGPGALPLEVVDAHLRWYVDGELSGRSGGPGLRRMSEADD